MDWSQSLAPPMMNGVISASPRTLPSFLGKQSCPPREVVETFDTMTQTIPVCVCIWTCVCKQWPPLTVQPHVITRSSP